MGALGAYGPFLIGLGIIVGIVYLNSLYDYIKARKAKKQQNTEELLYTKEAGEAQQDSVIGQSISVVGDSLQVASYIEQALATEKYLFGMPMTVCESDGTGVILAIDRRENLYVIETVLRSGYEDMYDQLKEDMGRERKRIPQKDAARKVYGIVCTNQPSPLLKAAVSKNPDIRIFSFHMVFENIY